LVRNSVWPYSACTFNVRVRLAY